MTASTSFFLISLVHLITGVPAWGFLPISSKANCPMRTSLQGQSFDIEYLSRDPDCFIVKDFLSEEECNKYINRADSADESLMKTSNAPQVSISPARLWPLPLLCLGFGIPPTLRLYESSEVSSISTEDVVQVASFPVGIALLLSSLLVILVPKVVQLYANSSSRTSKSIALNQEQDCDFIRNLVTKASEVAKQSWSNWEAPVITKYETGALFASHNDASPTKGSEWIDQGGQRVVTVITYLNTCSEGGGTKFDALDFTVQPKQGTALVFFPASSETMEADERTIHQSLPAIDEKYIVQLFGREKTVPSPLGIPAAFQTSED